MSDAERWRRRAVRAVRRHARELQAERRRELRREARRNKKGCAVTVLSLGTAAMTWKGWG